MKALILILLLALSACGTTARVGAYHDFEGDVAGDNPAALFEVKKEFSRGDCGYLHISHWTSGIPFNNRYEQNMDMLGCSAKLW